MKNEVSCMDWIKVPRNVRWPSSEFRDFTSGCRTDEGYIDHEMQNGRGEQVAVPDLMIKRRVVELFGYGG